MPEVNSALTEALTKLASTSNQDDQSSHQEVWVGDGKKFKDVEALAKAYTHADLRIKELDEDTKSSKDTSKLLEEVLGEIRKSSTAPKVEPDAGTPPPAGPSVKPEQIAEIVDKRIADRAAAAKAEANMDKAVQLLAEVYEDPKEAAKAFRSIIHGNPAVEQALNLLGATDPEKLVKFVTNTVPPKDPTSVTNAPDPSKSVAGVTIPTLGTGGLTWAYCRELRKKDPAQYASREFRAKMEAAIVDHSKRGKDFFATV